MREREKDTLSLFLLPSADLSEIAKGTRTTDVSSFQSTERERERKRFVLPLAPSIGSQ